MSAFLSAGASFTPSPVIATICPFCFSDLDEADLVLGRDAGDDADAVDLLDSLVVRHRAELRAGDRAALDAELLRDRLCGHRVIAGDHPHSDAGRSRGRDRLLGLGARRIDNPHERKHRQPIQEWE